MEWILQHDTRIRCFSLLCSESGLAWLKLVNQSPLVWYFCLWCTYPFGSSGPKQIHTHTQTGKVPRKTTNLGHYYFHIPMYTLLLVVWLFILDSWIFAFDFIYFLFSLFKSVIWFGLWLNLPKNLPKHIGMEGSERNQNAILFEKKEIKCSFTMAKQHIKPYHINTGHIIHLNYQRPIVGGHSGR